RSRSRPAPARERTHLPLSPTKPITARSRPTRARPRGASPRGRSAAPACENIHAPRPIPAADLGVHRASALALLPRARGGPGRGRARDLVAPSRRVLRDHICAGAQGPLLLRLVRPPRAGLRRREPARGDPGDPGARAPVARGGGGR